MFRKNLKKVMVAAVAMGIGLTSVAAGSVTSSAKEKDDFSFDPIYEQEVEQGLDIYTDETTNESYLPGIVKTYYVDSEGNKYLISKDVYKYNKAGQLTTHTQTVYTVKTSYNKLTGKNDKIKTIKGKNRIYTTKLKYKNNKLIKKTYTSTNGGIMNGSVVKYSYKTNSVKAVLTLKNGMRSITNKTYNDNNLLITEKSVSQNKKNGKYVTEDSQTKTISYTYDVDGNCLSKDTSGMGSGKYEATYDKNGNIVTSSDTQDAGRTENISYTYTYSKNGTLKKSVAKDSCTDGNYKSEDTVTSFFNANGRCIDSVTVTSDDPDQVIVKKSTYKKGVMLSSEYVSNIGGEGCDLYKEYSNYKVIERDWN